MFFIRKNVIVLAKCTQKMCKNVLVQNRPNYFAWHPSFSNFFIIRNQSSHQIDSKKLEANESLNEGPGEVLSIPPNMIDEMTNGDEELEHKLKIIMLETEVLRQDGKPVPPNEYMNLEMWQQLLKLPSRSGRAKYLEFLFKCSKKKENRLAKKIEKKKEYEKFMLNKEETPKNISIEEHAFKYGLSYNNIFIRFSDSTMNHFYNRRLVQALQFGQKLVVDCGYDENMTKRENYNTAKQLMLLFSENRNNDDPFDIHYVNMNKESDLEAKLHKYIPTMYEASFPMNIHEKSYLDLFPKQNLIYLTPHCREVMDEFDHDAIYILGAIVDKVNNDPLSLAKAKRQGITMKKFPLDQYLQWSSGSGKSLTINQCVAILLDMKATNDWNYAFRHVPRRKLMDTTTSIINNNNTRHYKDAKQFSMWDKKDTKKYSDQKKNTWKPSIIKKSVNSGGVYNE